MKRKNKLVLTGILAIIYIIIALNFHRIKFALSMFRIYSEEKKIESVDDNTEKTHELVMDNPLESILSKVDNVDNTNENEDEKDETVDKPGGKGDVSGQSDKNDKGNVVKNDSKRSYESIINEYNIQFENLKAAFEGELDALIGQGVKEYKEGNLSTSQLASRYLSTGAKLEKISDDKFNSVLKNMEKELKANGHDTSIVKEVKSYYNSFKESKKSDLIGRGMKHVK